MKQLFLFFMAGIALSCNNQDTSSKDTMPDADHKTTASATNYPYTIEHPDNWEIGNSSNTMTALNSLKAWEEGNVDESLQYFADTIHVQFDGLDKHMSNDSLKAMFASGWNEFKNVDIKMTDWESVVSKDKQEEWVTLWYTQQWEMKKGAIDSVAVVNDFEFKDGKIIRIVEYRRQLH